MMAYKNIIKTEDSCTIYVTRAGRVCILVQNLLLLLVIIFLSVRLNMYKSGLGIFIFSIGYLCYVIELYLNIKHVINPPGPIVFTKRELSLPDGEKVQWEYINSLFMKPGSFTPPTLCIQTTKRHDIDLLDWYLYADKKQLISLFEEYAGRKLYVGMRLKSPSTNKVKKQKETPFIQKSPYRNPYGHNRKT